VILLVVPLVTASGARMPSGSYVARLEGEDGTRTLKLMLVK